MQGVSDSRQKASLTDIPQLDSADTLEQQLDLLILRLRRVVQEPNLSRRAYPRILPCKLFVWLCRYWRVLRRTELEWERRLKASIDAHGASSSLKAYSDSK